MPALNFQKQFAPMVLSGEKSQTIRAIWKNPVQQKKLFVPGAKVSLWTGMRTKGCEKLGEAVIEEVEPFLIEEMDGMVFIGTLSRKQMDELARLDGFKDWPEMETWFDKTHGLPFEGLLIRWTDFKPEEKTNAKI